MVIIYIQLQGTELVHIPPNGKKENHRLKSTFERGYVSSQEGIVIQSWEIFSTSYQIAFKSWIEKPSRFTTTGGVARSFYLYPVFTKRRSLTSVYKSPLNLQWNRIFYQPTFVSCRNRWRHIQPLYTKRWTPARCVSWPLDFFFVSDVFHHITSPISPFLRGPINSRAFFVCFWGHGFRYVLTTWTALNQAWQVLFTPELWKRVRRFRSSENSPKRVNHQPPPKTIN